MSDVFWQNLSNILSQVVLIIGSISGLLTLLYQIWSKQDARKGREELKATVQQVGAGVETKLDDVAETAVRSRHEITQAFMAGERSGFVGGIKEGLKQATGPMPLSDK